MKTLLLLLTLSIHTLFATPLHTVVSIVPEKQILQHLGGEYVDVTVMVQAGNSPHTYEPKPSQMLAIHQAQLYFAMGVEFEHRWLPKFQSLNPSMKIIDLSQGIEKRTIQSHKGHTTHQRLDPHIWTTPENIAKIGKTMTQALIEADPQHRHYFETHLQTLIEQTQRVDKTIRNILAPLQDNRSFMVLHPSWGYFAHAYGLKQIAVEIEGKEPKPKALVHLIQEAKAQKVHAIFVQPEFSDQSAQIIAHTLHIPVRKISPMAPSWSQNLQTIAKAIAGKE